MNELSGMKLPEEELRFARGISGRIKEKMAWVEEKNRGRIPYTTGEDGSYDDRRADLCWWTNGFWGGLMWQLYTATGQEAFRRSAEWLEEQLDACIPDVYGLHHDVGFMWMPTAVADYRLTGNADARRRGLLAAQLLAGRFNPAGDFIRAWNDLPEEDTAGWAIIDCMMNLTLLYWASKETGDPRYRHIAMRHADTAQRAFVREDGSVNHIVEFDPETGKVLRSLGGQGFGEGSAWTRGQAWAIYGFTLSYLHTGKTAYLETAKKAASFFLSCLGEDGLVPVDFRQPGQPALEDSCAAAVAASGLIELSRAMDGLTSQQYLDGALLLLHTLCEKRCSWGRECDAMVQNCTAAYHSPDRHITMVYADYYLTEAIFKLTGEGFFLW